MRRINLRRRSHRLNKRRFSSHASRFTGNDIERLRRKRFPTRNSGRIASFRAVTVKVKNIIYMADLFDYLAWRGDLDFFFFFPNHVDYLIFSQISYLPFDGIVPGTDEKEGISVYIALKKLEKKLKEGNNSTELGLSFHEDSQLISALSASTRFRNCHLFGYVNQIDTDREYQFSAVCIYTGGSYCIAFRGTDATFVGWKEDFNMAFRDVIPSQLEAVNYVEKTARKTKGSLSICGHSKGGNLAAYSSAFCGKKNQKRIIAVYCYDSPGFNQKVIESKEFNAVKNRIRSYIPQGSVVGMLLEHGNKHTVVKSRETGLMQHSLYSWEVTHNDMIHVNNVTQGSLFVDKTIREWIGGLENDQREKFIEAVYTILTSSEMNTIHDIENSRLAAAGRIIKSLGNIDEPARKLIFHVLSELFRSAGRNIDTLFKPKNRLAV
jgi:hypothetical protein